jgi:hypothetical protein
MRDQLHDRKLTNRIDQIVHDSALSSGKTGSIFGVDGSGQRNVPLATYAGDFTRM